MRVPSRRMPPTREAEPTLAGWLIVAGIAGGALYLLITVPLITILIPLVTLISIRHKRRLRKRMNALAASRSGESICTFARAFDRRTTDTWVIRAVYEQVQAQLDDIYACFPIRPNDRLTEDLKID